MRRAMPQHFVPAWHGEIELAAERGITLPGTLDIPPHALGLVLFAHGSGSSRHSPRNRHVARVLGSGGLATLLFDLLTHDEARSEAASGDLRFDIGLLGDRLRTATRWARENDATASLRIGFFGASTGAAAALLAAADPQLEIAAVVSRGGRPDLAGSALRRVQAPTLLIVGGDDDGVIELNEKALAQLSCLKRLEIVPGASHLFEEPGTLDAAAELAKRWLAEHLPAQGWHP